MGHLPVYSKGYEGWAIGINPIQVSTLTRVDLGFLEKGVHKYKCVAVRFQIADFISFY